MEEMNRLIKTVRATYYGSAWIGLYDDLNSWRWSLNNAILEGGFKSWYVQQPINSGGQSLCVYMSYSEGLWRDSFCSIKRHFVCYDGRANANTRYVLVDQIKTWNEAQSYCREHYTDLVSIRNRFENYRVRALFSYFYTLWIGLYRTRSWSDQSNSSFSNWKTEQPDNAGNSEYCTAVSFSDSGKWTDEKCSTILPFVCYRDPSSQPNHSTQPQPNQEYVMGMRVKVTSADNLSESQIVELITPLQEELIRLGLPSNVSMHLRGYRKINP
ncbi:C-type mannose receptor 2 isoform X1 [Labeo rohita]|uniref:C-type mannose receptor 2 isoform X1 n=1 Tax=Labeo rohita TaxID=84645 RepID=UPI0021E340CB|nr:C-type mannose receptor 2 isoform X1 [Labeo rohita]